MKNVSVLIIGCGNIGAKYDTPDSPFIRTHVKAFVHLKTNVVVTDEDSAKAQRVARQYKVESSPLNLLELADFDLVSIATPTPTHAHFLTKLIAAKIPVIICEKPVGSTLQELRDIIKRYTRGNSKIIVNYIRRFQPEYEVLKKRIKKILAKEELTHAVVKYHRGFLNNASHACDLINYLFDEQVTLMNLRVTEAVNDVFSYDPTISGQFTYMNSEISLIGIKATSFSIFEIELIFTGRMIRILNGGNTIQYFQKTKTNSLEEVVELRQAHVLDTYMLPVARHALAMLRDAAIADNFEQSVNLNLEMLKTLKKIKPVQS